MKIILHSFCFLLCFFICASAFSQRQPGGPGDELLKLKMQKFMEALQVDSTTAIKYFTAAIENRKQINQLNKRRVSLLKDIEGNLDASDLGSKIDEIADIEISVANQRRSFLNEIKTILTPKQIAQAMLLEKKFGKKLKEEIQKRKRDKDDGNPDE